VGLYTELFYAIIPTLFLCFLLVCYPYILYFLMFLILVFYISLEHERNQGLHEVSFQLPVQTKKMNTQVSALNITDSF